MVDESEEGDITSWGQAECEMPRTADAARVEGMHHMAPINEEESEPAPPNNLNREGQAGSRTKVARWHHARDSEGHWEKKPTAQDGAPTAPQEKKPLGGKGDGGKGLPMSSPVKPKGIADHKDRPIGSPLKF